MQEIEDNPDLKFMFISNVLASWAQVYAEREKVDTIAGIEEPDYSDLDIAIVENDFRATGAYVNKRVIDQLDRLCGETRDLTEKQWAVIQEGWTIPSLKQNILALESRILRHSLGVPDMSPEYIRAYHNLLFRHDYGRYEKDYGATYQKRIDTFLRIRKHVMDTEEDDIKLLNSVFPEFKLWWEQLWGRNKGTNVTKKKEGS